MPTLKSFTDQVHKMRLAQERYFELAVLARKNHIHTKEKKDALTIAKNLEKQVDASIQEIKSQLLEEDYSRQVKAVHIDKSYFKTENF